MSNEWGHAVYEHTDGSRLEVPLQEPPALIPEDARQYLVQRPGLSLWTRKGTEHMENDDEDAVEVVAEALRAILGKDTVSLGLTFRARQIVGALEKSGHLPVGASSGIEKQP